MTVYDPLFLIDFICPGVLEFSARWPFKMASPGGITMTPEQQTAFERIRTERGKLQAADDRLTDLSDDITKLPFFDWLEADRVRKAAQVRVNHAWERWWYVSRKA